MDTIGCACRFTASCKAHAKGKRAIIDRIDKYSPGANIIFSFEKRGRGVGDCGNLTVVVMQSIVNTMLPEDVMKKKKN